MRFVVLAIFVVLLVATTSCFAATEHNRKLLNDGTTHEIHQRKLKESVDSSVNNHHYIPRQDFGNGGGSSSDANLENHHYIPRQDFNNGGSIGDANDNEIKT
uniref:Homeobox protein like n=1 Tax=Tanacetum cinerariifolium TaxID=118510 RepID=A0A6L2MU35_TANCI|nr:homeobox protein like [Tanacetum cinerariifolium]